MNLENFIYKCFYTIAPARELSKNWHIKCIAYHLDNIQERKRLIISIPPRCMKSICISVAWPAWILGHHPSANIVVASYSQGLSIKHSLDTRCIMQSAWYKEMFPDTILSREHNTKNKFLTTKRGFRLATSVGGTLTGEGADILIADDPITPMTVHSVKYRERVINWFEQVFVNRLNCLKKGVIIVIMHRLHQEDLVAHLLAKKLSKWQHLSLPMIAASQHKVPLGKGTFYLRPQDHILDTNRFTKNDLEDIKQDMGSFAFAAQYQQQPIASSHGIIKKEYFKKYSALPIENYRVAQSWDTASSSNENSDYSVCITYTVINSTIYIIDIMRDKFDYPQLKEKIIMLSKRWAVDEIIIEEKASGIQLLQELTQQNLLPIIGIQPKLNKIGRLNIVLPMIEAGKVALPYYASWLVDFEHEVLTFPHSTHDDQLDSLTQLLLRIKDQQQNNLLMRQL